MTDEEISGKFVSQSKLYLDEEQSFGFINRLWNLEDETDLISLMETLTAKNTTNVESN
jgi:hypothetical protein